MDDLLNTISAGHGPAPRAAVARSIDIRGNDFLAMVAKPEPGPSDGLPVGTTAPDDQTSPESTWHMQAEQPPGNGPIHDAEAGTSATASHPDAAIIISALSPPPSSIPANRLPVGAGTDAVRTPVPGTTGEASGKRSPPLFPGQPVRASTLPSQDYATAAAMDVQKGQDPLGPSAPRAVPMAVRHPIGALSILPQGPLRAAGPIGWGVSRVAPTAPVSVANPTSGPIAVPLKGAVVEIGPQHALGDAARMAGVPDAAGSGDIAAATGEQPPDRGKASLMAPVAVGTNVASPATPSAPTARIPEAPHGLSIGATPEMTEHTQSPPPATKAQATAAAPGAPSPVPPAALASPFRSDARNMPSELRAEPDFGAGRHTVGPHQPPIRTPTSPQVSNAPAATATATSGPAHATHVMADAKPPSSGVAPTSDLAGDLPHGTPVSLPTVQASWGAAARSAGSMGTADMTAARSKAHGAAPSSTVGLQDGAPLDPARTVRLDPAAEMGFGPQPEARGGAAAVVSDIRGAPPQPAAALIARQIVLAAPEPGPDGTRTIELTLDPPELGRLRLGVTETNGVFHLSIAADRPETADLIRRHLALLGGEFQRAGLDAPSVDVSEQQTGGRNRQVPPEQRDGTIGPAPRSADTDRNTNARDASGNLDLRL